MAISLLGDGIFFVALPWQVYQLSNAATALSVVGIAMSIPQIVLLLVGGVVSDRFDRRRVMMAADVIRGLAVAALGLLSISGSIQLWHVMVIAAAFGAGTAFFGPAFDAIVPELVPAELLTQANSLDHFVRPAAWRMLGPALGGWIIAGFGDRAGGAFVVDAATFGASILCLSLMRSRVASREAAGEVGPAWREIREGFRYVWSQTWLWGTLVAAAFAYLVFLGPTEVLLPHVVKYEMGGSARDLGFILALGGVGAMGAAVLMGHREMPRRNMTFIYLVWTASTLSVAGYGLAHFPWQAMVACFLFNALEGAGTIVWITTKQRLVPNRLLGRVSSLDWFISIGLLPVSYALTGPVAAALGVRATLVWAGVIGGAVTLAFLFLPGMRDVERSEALTDGHGAPARLGHSGPGASPVPVAGARMSPKDA
jgi:DHA3 family tetracycline resistance protein-like MFS transporter